MIVKIRPPNLFSYQFEVNDSKLDFTGFPSYLDKQIWMTEFELGNYEVISDVAPIVLQPNWDELYRRLLDGDLKPILESIQGASTQSLPVNTAFTQMIAVFQPTIRTEQALRDCLDALISFGFSIKSEHKILWNAAISECEFSDLVKIN